MLIDAVKTVCCQKVVEQSKIMPWKKPWLEPDPKRLLEANHSTFLIEAMCMQLVSGHWVLTTN